MQSYYDITLMNGRNIIKYGVRAKHLYWQKPFCTLDNNIQAHHTTQTPTKQHEDCLMKRVCV